MSSIILHEGDNRVTLRRLIDQGVRVHAVCTDPPYGLVSVTKRFGGDKAAPAKFGSDGAFARASAGFMGSKWDGTGIERDPEFWKLVWEILLPGGYVLAFSSPRTGHWQACAMEMAGFVMHPFIGWAYGQGFPKDHDAAMAIDKTLGHPGHKAAVGEPKRRLRPGGDQNKDATWEKLEDRTYQPGTYVPGSPEAQQWDGWSYGGQAMKPALEPIYFGQKPFSEKTGALNLLKHGVGAVNIDACRVSAGRHPANLVHDGSAEVVALFPRTGGGDKRGKGQGTRPPGFGDVGSENGDGLPCGQTYADGGSAARFFNAFSPDPIIYQAKATKADRAGSRHPTVKPVALMRWLLRLITPVDGIVLDPFAGSGTTGEAARQEGFDCLLLEAEPQFSADIRARFALDSAASDDFDAVLGINTDEDALAAILG